MDLQDLLTVTQAADALGISRGRVHHLITAGRLPAIRIHTRLLLIRRQDLARVRHRRPGRPKIARKSKSAT